MHEIKIKDFENWLDEKHEIEYACSYGKGSNKNIFISLNDNYIKVRDHNMIVYEGRNINNAVKIYNNCV